MQIQAVSTGSPVQAVYSVERSRAGECRGMGLLEHARNWNIMDSSRLAARVCCYAATESTAPLRCSSLGTAADAAGEGGE